ncbi:MAG: hypothetical protein SGJ11_07375 [Phycisphaerae bacterium]|nr:hypothetical protein [Phycisphaerae bacterium]
MKDRHTTPDVEERKSITWRALAQAHADRARGQRMLRASAAGGVLVACVVTCLVLIRLSGSENTVTREVGVVLRSTAIVDVMTARHERPLVEIVSAPRAPIAILALDDDALLDELADAGIDRALIRVGDTVRVAIRPRQPGGGQADTDSRVR